MAHLGDAVADLDPDAFPAHARRRALERLQDERTGNVVHDQFSSGHAIYSDNGSANMMITGNAMCQK